MTRNVKKANRYGYKQKCRGIGQSVPSHFTLLKLAKHSCLVTLIEGFKLIFHSTNYIEIHSLFNSRMYEITPC